MSSVAKELEGLEKLVGKPTKYKVTIHKKLIDHDEQGEEQLVLVPEVHTLWVSQVKTGQIPKLIRASGTLMGVLTDKSSQIDLPRVMMIHSEECLDLLSVLIEKDRDFVDSIEVDDAIKLLGLCIETNMDFFVRRVLPSLSGGLQVLLEKLKETKGSKSDGKTLPPT